MGCKELIESLRRSAETDIAGIRNEAEVEVQRIRAEASERIDSIRARYRNMVFVDTSRKAEKILMDAEKKALSIRLEAEKAFSNRCLAIARNLLTDLRDDKYGETFERMAGELPHLEWKRVKVNPEDRERAGRLFPAADIILDPAISGGMEAEAEEGKVRVINTFEKRLEHAWESIFREVITAVCGKEAGLEPAGKD